MRVLSRRRNIRTGMHRACCSASRDIGPSSPSLLMPLCLVLSVECSD